MRRISAAEGMLLATVTIWAFNFTVTRCAVTRVPAARVLRAPLQRGRAGSLGITYRWELLRFQRRHAVFLAGAAFIGIYLNSIGFMYAIDLTNASTVALIFGSLPIVTAIVAYAFGVERCTAASGSPPRSRSSVPRSWPRGPCTASPGTCSEICSPRRGDLGLLLGRDRAAAPPLLGLADQRGALAFGAVPLVIRFRSCSTRTGTRAARVGRVRLRGARPARPHELPLVPAIERVGPSRATLVTNLSPSSLRSSPSCCCRRS